MRAKEYPDYLEHFGIKGMKWGVRRFQNKDGSYTAAGLKRRLGGAVGKAKFAVGKAKGSGKARGGSGSNAEAEARKAKIKKYAKGAAIAVGTAAALYGGYKLAKSGKGQQAISALRSAAGTAKDNAGAFYRKNLNLRNPKSAASNVRQALKHPGTTAKNLGSAARDSAGAFYRKNLNLRNPKSAASNARQALRNPGSTAKKVGSAIRDRAGSVGSAVRDRAGSVGSAVRDRAGSFYRKNLNLRNPKSAASNARQALKHPGTLAKNAGSAARSAVGSVAGSARDKAGSFYRKNLNLRNPKSAASNARQALKHPGTLAKNAGSAAKSLGGRGLSAVRSGVKSGVSRLTPSNVKQSRASKRADSNRLAGLKRAMNLSESGATRWRNGYGVGSMSQRTKQRVSSAAKIAGVGAGLYGAGYGGMKALGAAQKRVWAKQGYTQSSSKSSKSSKKRKR